MQYQNSIQTIIFKKKKILDSMTLWNIFQMDIGKIKKKKQKLDKGKD